MRDGLIRMRDCLGIDMEGTGMSADIHTLAGAYALNAVDELERAAFERHLADCESCRQEVTELRETVARLADDTVVEAMPQGLRERTLVQAARTPQVRSAAAGDSATRQPRRERSASPTNRWAVPSPPRESWARSR
ncbi:zf-HC2 domain-containing protein [Micromonospora sp. NPDC005979]|uniref:RskA family anti-sigma factor n=1 Tax=Micromonospora sp. NPDC005979 TaxID=3156726 RepID=UPI00339F5E10